MVTVLMQAILVVSITNFKASLNVQSQLVVSDVVLLLKEIFPYLNIKFQYLFHVYLFIYLD